MQHPTSQHLYISLRSQHVQIVFQCSIFSATMTISYPKTQHNNISFFLQRIHSYFFKTTLHLSTTSGKCFTNIYNRFFFIISVCCPWYTREVLETGSVLFFSIKLYQILMDRHAFSFYNMHSSLTVFHWSALWKSPTKTWDGTCLCLDLVRQKPNVLSVWDVFPFNPTDQKHKTWVIKEYLYVYQSTCGNCGSFFFSAYVQFRVFAIELFLEIFTVAKMEN